MSDHTSVVTDIVRYHYPPVPHAEGYIKAIVRTLADAGLLITPEIQAVLDFASIWRAEWLVPVVENADDISEGDELLAGAVDDYQASLEPKVK